MNIRSILTPDRTFSSIEASSKKRAMEVIAEKIATAVPELETGMVYRQLIEREKLGSTAIGSGVALPHTRLSECDHIVGALFVFKEPIDFSAYDDIPVQIVFALLAERFQQAHYRELLLSGRSSADLYDKAVALDESNDTTAAAQQ
jgi:PTS system nitrogen regulatory IIA component